MGRGGGWCLCHDGFLILDSHAHLTVSFLQSCFLHSSSSIFAASGVCPLGGLAIAYRLESEYGVAMVRFRPWYSRMAAVTSSGFGCFGLKDIHSSNPLRQFLICPSVGILWTPQINRKANS